MNNKKLLSAAILLALAKSALGIEVEPNNDSSKANPLGTENVGKLNRASDVDFFKIDSCIKDNAKKCTNKRREEVSISFTCSNKSSASPSGWFLGVHDSNGELQETYPVKPDDCIISDKTSGAFNFKFSSLDSPNYYVSVVADCQAPIYNTVTDPKDPTKTIVNVNKFVAAALTKQADINAVKAENVLAQTAIDKTKNDLILTEMGISPYYNDYITAAKKNIDAAKKLSPTSDLTSVETAIKAIDLTSKTDTDKAIFKNSIDAVQSEITKVKNLEASTEEIKNLLTNASNNLDSIFSPSFSYINSNANIQKLTDALALTTDISSLASITLTPATNISAAMSATKAIGIAGSAMQYSIYTWSVVLDAETATKNPTIAANIEAADAALAIATTNATQAATAATAADKALGDAQEDLKTARAGNPRVDADITAAQTAISAANTRKTGNDTGTGTTGTDGAKITADNTKTAAENAKKKADNVKTAADKVFTDAKAKYDEAKTKLIDALKAVDDAVKSLNDTINANILAANTAENLGKRFDSACKDNYNVGIYTLKDNPDNEIKRLEDIASKEQKNLGLEQSGQISSIDDIDIYVVDSDGTTEVPLLFTCSALAARQTNDWKLSIYNDANGLVSSTLINGSSCGSVFIGDKGGYSFKLPKGSQRYYLAVESACASSTKKDCAVDTAEYSILRDVDKVYSGRLTAANTKITATSADLKLTNCGLNNDAVISIKVENVDLAETAKLGASKLPINVQIGSTACRILTPELSSKDVIIGSVIDSSEIIDSSAIAKDSTNITLGDCGGSNAKVTLTGSKLDLVNFNPNKTTDSIVIPIKVNIGDFKCETQEVFYITPDASGTGATYSNISLEDTFQPLPDTPVPVDPNAFDRNWLTTKKNLGATLQTGQINAVNDTQIYQVDTGTEDANLTFGCNKAVRYQNDWKMLIYDSAKNLKSTTMINGSSCGIGQAGDSGAYAIPLTKDSSTYYLIVKSACEIDDKTCAIDKSQYQLKRVTATQAVTNAAAKPCFGTGCTTTKPVVKPFFTSPK